MQNKYESLTAAVVAAQNGDKDAFGYIYEQTCREKRYIAIKYVRNDADAEDVVADAYVKAWERIGSLEDPNKVSAWLGQIVARIALDLLKKKKPKLFSDVEKDVESMTSLERESIGSEDQPEKLYTVKEREDIIREMIDSLSDEQRICVLMYYYDEMSVSQIAEILNCPEGTVMSRLNYARKALRVKAEALQKKGYNFYSIAPLPLFIRLLAIDAAESDVSGVVGAVLAGGVAGTASGAAGTTGFLGTMAGKVTMGAAGIAVVAGLTLGGVFISDRIGVSDEAASVVNTLNEDTPADTATGDDVGSDVGDQTGTNTETVMVNDDEIPDLVDGGLKKNELEAMLACLPENMDDRTLTKREITEVIINGTFFYEDKTIPGSGQRRMKIEDANRLLSAITDYRFTDKASSTPMVRVLGDELVIGDVSGEPSEYAMGWGDRGYHWKNVTIEDIVKNGPDLVVTYERTGVVLKRMTEPDSQWWETSKDTYKQRLKATMQLTDDGKYRVKKVKAISPIEIKD